MRRFCCVFLALVALFSFPFSAWAGKPATVLNLTQPPIVDGACSSHQPGEPYCHCEEFTCNRGFPFGGLYLCSDQNGDGSIDVQDCVDFILEACGTYGGGTYSYSC